MTKIGEHPRIQPILGNHSQYCSVYDLVGIIGEFDPKVVQSSTFSGVDYISLLESHEDELGSHGWGTTSLQQSIIHSEIALCLKMKNENQKQMEELNLEKTYPVKQVKLQQLIGAFLFCKVRNVEALNNNNIASLSSIQTNYDGNNKRVNLKVFVLFMPLGLPFNIYCTVLHINEAPLTIFNLIEK